MKKYLVFAGYKDTSYIDPQASFRGSFDDLNEYGVKEIKYIFGKEDVIRCRWYKIVDRDTFRSVEEYGL